LNFDALVFQMLFDCTLSITLITRTTTYYQQQSSTSCSGTLVMYKVFVFKLFMVEYSWSTTVHLRDSSVVDLVSNHSISWTVDTLVHTKQSSL